MWRPRLRLTWTHGPRPAVQSGAGSWTLAGGGELDNDATIHVHSGVTPERGDRGTS